ncbi:MAG: preprotein translocase subunit SecG [Bacteroidales bacterium]|jgi:preprotein translocase subunit SecG|nr:preprotein translocase subunit SecG [Bacteroidales bacterium]MCK9498971.1 preprotein translocase subunit SecG [Bacteroidales bacterium]MDY0313850.1 preprotein translocase subunit SecG [Bacteroidales bacterium]NLB86166.1 preprotein translocase subunit SecG [Bacteroidales bacterium]
MYIFFSVLIVICAILLILIVLVQNSKGGGLASGFGQGNQVMGVKKTADFLEKATWGLAIGLIVFSLLASFSIPGGSKRKQQDIEQTQTEQTAGDSESMPSEQLPVGE